MNFNCRLQTNYLILIALQLRESERARAEIHCPFRKIEGGVKTFDSSLRKEDASKHPVGAKEFRKVNCTGEQAGHSQS